MVFIHAILRDLIVYFNYTLFLRIDGAVLASRKVQTVQQMCPGVDLVSMCLFYANKWVLQYVECISNYLCG